MPITRQNGTGPKKIIMHTVIFLLLSLLQFDVKVQVNICIVIAVLDSDHGLHI